MVCSVLSAAAMAATMKISGLAEVHGSAFYEDFADLDLKGWSVAEYDFSNPVFATDWRKANVLTGENGLILIVEPQLNGQNPYVGSSIRRQNRSGTGRYSVVMQPAKGPGLITGFFVYTGPYYGTPHDEIDIEFLGRDTTRVQVGRFLNGQQVTKTIDLGFDAAAAPREYGFDWTDSEIVWWVDGCEIHRMSSMTVDLPKGEAYLFANLWVASEQSADWAGRADPNTKGKALIQSISYTPLP